MTDNEDEEIYRQETVALGRNLEIHRRIAEDLKISLETVLSLKVIGLLGYLGHLTKIAEYTNCARRHDEEFAAKQREVMDLVLTELRQSRDQWKDASE